MTLPRNRNTSRAGSTTVHLAALSRQSTVLVRPARVHLTWSLAEPNPLFSTIIRIVEVVEVFLARRVIAPRFSANSPRIHRFSLAVQCTS